MTDLNYSIEGKSADDIAKYFDVSIILVKEAISRGAKTYYDIYDYVKKEYV